MNTRGGGGQRAEAEERTIDKHVARRSGQGGGDAVEVPCQPHLASKARGVGEAECHVEHVVFIVLLGGKVMRWW